MHVMEGLRRNPCRLVPNWVRAPIKKSSGVAQIFFFWKMLAKKVSQLSKHPHLAEKQSAYFKNLKELVQPGEAVITSDRKLLAYCPRGDPELPLGCCSMHHTSVSSVLAWKRRGASPKFLLCFRWNVTQCQYSTWVFDTSHSWRTETDNGVEQNPLFFGWLREAIQKQVQPHQHCVSRHRLWHYMRMALLHDIPREECTRWGWDN